MVLGKRNVTLLLLLSAVALGLLGLIPMLWMHGGECGAPDTVTKKVVETRVVKRVEQKPTLHDEDGQPIALNEIAPDRKVALIVMKGKWCSVCTSQMERLSDRAHEIWGAQGFVAGLTDHAPAENAALADELGAFPVLSDADHDQLKAWGLYPEGASHPTPGIVFLDEQGRMERVVKGRYPGKPQEELILNHFRN